MKKLLLLFFASSLLAVGAQAQVSYGIKAGVNLPKLKISADNTSVTTDMSTNFYVSSYANIFAAPNFAIQPGVSFQGKGAKIKEGGAFDFGQTGTDVDELTISLMSIEVPVNALYYIPTGTVGSLFVGAGPYFGVNVAVKGKANGVTEDGNFGSETGDFKRIDYGFNFQAGFRFANGLLINGGYGLGLANVWNTVDGINTRNHVLSFGLGFEF